MILRKSFLLVAFIILFAELSFAQPRAYIPNFDEDTVSVVDTGSNTVIDTITVGTLPNSSVVTPDGTKVYITRGVMNGRVEVIQASTNTVIDTINVGTNPSDIAITPDGSFAYVTNFNSFNVSKIDIATDTVVNTIALPIIGSSCNPNGIVAHPTLDFVYVTSGVCNRLLPIDTSTDTVLPAANRTVITGANDIDITPNGSKIYVTDRSGTPTVQIINLAAGVPPGAVSVIISLSDGLCDADPSDVAVDPDGDTAWVMTQSFSTVPNGCAGPPPSIFNGVGYVLINTITDGFTLIGGNPESFNAMGFKRDGTSFYGLNILGFTKEVPASLPIMPGTQINLGDVPVARSPYFLGPDTSQLTITKTGDGDGTVTSMNPAGIDCGDTCDATITTGMVVTLTASANGSSVFNGWGMDCSGMGTDTMITVSADSECTAEFITQQFNVDITINPPGGGSVTSSPSGINCPGTCSQLFDINSFVNLNETADPDFNFVNWTGDVDCADGDIDDLTMDTSCTANFDIKRFTVTVNIAGDGTGSVASAPPGIFCPGDCSEEYIIHTMVNLNETANPDSDFIGWTGPADCTDGIIQDLTADITCTATFNLKRFTLNITKSGVGNGVVTSVPLGIDCGADCDEEFIIGTEVSLNATADPVSIFTGFSGDSDCEDGVVNMLSDITCNANFDFLPLILNPIFPAIASNVNEISADVASPNGPVAFVWGFMPGATTIGGPTCNGITLGIKNPQLLSISNANMEQTATYIFFIPLIGDFELPILTQAIDIETCRLSEVILNIIRKL